MKLTTEQIEYLNDRIDYDKKTGKCFWNKNNTKHHRGKEVGTIKKGYRMSALTMDKKRYDFYLHHYIYQRFNGNIPSGMVIDHIDRNPLNNKIENLRIVTISDNNKNRSAYGKSNHKGVAILPSGSFNTFCSYKGKKVTAGTFKDIDIAIAAANKLRFELLGVWPE